MLSEITGKLHIKESELWLEVQVFLVLTRLIHACPEAEVATAGFPPAVFLTLAEGTTLQACSLGLAPQRLWRCSVPLPWLYGFLSAV